MGRKVLITGGTRGIGKAVALRFARDQAELVLGYFQNRTAAEATETEARSLGAQVVLHQIDLKDERQIPGMFDRVKGIFEKLDVFVHCAASGVLKPASQITPKHWDWAMNTNARSFLTCATEAAAVMVEGGRMVALSSLGAGRVVPRYSSIGVSKAALESLTRYLAVEMAPRGISVNVVSAGAVETDVWKLLPDGKEILEQVRARTPAARLPSPEDIAEAVYFLASPQAQMIQGQVLMVDGGYSLLA